MDISLASLLHKRTMWKCGHVDLLFPPQCGVRSREQEAVSSDAPMQPTVAMTRLRLMP